MPIKKKRIVEKVIAFEGEQDFILGNNKPEYISAGEVLYVDANGTTNRLDPDSNELIPTNTSGSAPIRQDTIQSPSTDMGSGGSGTSGSTSTATTTTPPNCINCCILNTSGTIITIGSLEAFLGKKLACSQLFSPVDSGQKGSILLTPEEISILNPSANWEISSSPCPLPSTPCDASIDQFNITTDGTTAKVNITIKQSIKPVRGIVYILDGGSEKLSTQPNFTIDNLSVGDHSLMAFIECTDGSRIGKQTKSFTITKPTITRPDNVVKPVDPSIIDQLTPKPTTTVTSTTTFVPPFTFGGGFGGGGGGETVKTEVKKKSQFPFLLLLLIAGTLFVLTRDKEKK